MIFVLQCVSIVAMPLWQFVAVRFGKKTAYASGMTVSKGEGIMIVSKGEGIMIVSKGEGIMIVSTMICRYHFCEPDVKLD